MMKVSFGLGTVITVLVPVALTLFGVLSVKGGISAFLLLFGAWGVIFGTTIGGRRSRLYYAGWGLVLMAFSSFIVLPATYVIGLVVVAVLIVVIAYMFSMGNRSKAGAAPPTAISSPAS